MADQGWAELAAFAGHLLSALLIAYGVVSRRPVLICSGLALLVIVVGVWVGTRGSWWTGEIAILLALFAIGALVIVLTRR